MWRLKLCFALILLHVSATAAPTLECTVHSGLMHLRRGPQREWQSFANVADAQELNRVFPSRSNQSTWTLSLRQIDVKESWQIKINDRVIGTLVRDENDLITDVEIPPGTLRDGDNQLKIVRSGRDTGDDIRVGDIQIHTANPKTLRSESTVIIDLIGEDRKPIPGRITIADSRGVLVPVSPDQQNHLAVREGVIYTSTGSAKFGVAAGGYRVFGSRGFEYSAPTETFTVDSGVTLKRTLTLQREVDTRGWVACDTHIHTVTHSGHGDCTIDERMATLAGEGIELPIATDHNKHINYMPIATSMVTASIHHH